MEVLVGWVYNAAMSIAIDANNTVPKAYTKVATAAGVGILIGLATGLFTTWTAAPLAAWDAGVLYFVITTWHRVLKFDHALVKKHALREDPSRVATDVILVGASIASLAAVVQLLILASSEKGIALIALTLLGVASVVSSWLMVHTIYALKYAEMFYQGTEGGVDFSDNDPIYVDFAYLAFTIGMTYQVSDTTLQTREFRRTALKHALLSFLIGTVIIATTINFIGGLAK